MHMQSLVYSRILSLSLSPSHIHTRARARILADLFRAAFAKILSIFCVDVNDVDSSSCDILLYLSSKRGVNLSQHSQALDLFAWRLRRAYASLYPACNRRDA